MMKIFTKKNKGAKALLLASLLCSTSPLAMRYGVQNADVINDHDTFSAVAAKNIQLVQIPEPQDDGAGRNPNAERERRTVSYQPAVTVIENDVLRVKNQVIGSETFAYPSSKQIHKNGLTYLIREAFLTNNSPILDCVDDQIPEISAQLFRVGQNHLSRSHDRGEWMPDNNVVGGIFTFKYNNNREVSLLIRDLNMVLPMYNEHRVGQFNNWDAYTPLGQQLNNHQRASVIFLNRLLAERPARRFKSGLKYRMENPLESADTLWARLFPQPMLDRALVAPNAGDLDHLQNRYGPFYGEYQVAKEAQRLIAIASLNEAYAYADHHGLARNKLDYIHKHRELLTLDKFMGLTNPFYGTYQHANQVRVLINTASWEEVYRYAEQNLVSRENVAFVNQNRPALALKTYMQHSNPLYAEYVKADHTRHLINTASWQAVYDYVDANGISRVDMGYINLNRGGLDIPNYMNRTNPFYGPYEQVLQVQHLINTASWGAVYDYSDTNGLSREKVAYISKKRGLKTYSVQDIQLENEN